MEQLWVAEWKRERERTREIYVKKIYGFKFFAQLFKWFIPSDYMCWSNSTNWKLDYYFKILEKNHEISYHWNSNSLIQTGIQWQRLAYWNLLGDSGFLLYHCKIKLRKIRTFLFVSVCNKKATETNYVLFLFTLRHSKQSFSKFSKQNSQSISLFHIALLDFISQIISGED